MTTPDRPSGRTARRLSWDVVRVVAVLAVMFTHTTYMGPFLHPELGTPLGRYPFQVGASILLVISAYFVCVTIRRGSTARWLWRRACRVLPPYLAAVLVTYALLIYFGPDNWILPTRHDLWGNLTLAASFDPSIQLIDGSYWTLPLQLMAFGAAALLWPRGVGPRITTLLWIMIIAPVALQWNGRIDHSPFWVVQLWNGLGLHRLQLFGYLVAYRLMELGAGRLTQIAGAVAGVIGLAWLLTRYVEEPSYRALAGLRVRGLGARAFGWLNT